MSGFSRIYASKNVRVLSLGHNLLQLPFLLPKLVLHRILNEHMWILTCFLVVVIMRHSPRWVEMLPLIYRLRFWQVGGTGSKYLPKPWVRNSAVSTFEIEMTFEWSCP